jgi:hypothetical protein
MGYTNKDKRFVHVGRKEKDHVKRLRRLAEKREDMGQAIGKQAARARHRGWWYA